MEEYDVIRLTGDRIKDLYHLFISSSKERASLEKFTKKYDTQYTGKSYIGFLAYDKQGGPAAFYGVIPHMVKINNVEVLVAQSADTLTHPNHQRKGLFTKLAAKTYELATTEGVHFLYGIPNELSFPGFIKKLNWDHCGDLQVFEQKVLVLPVSYFFRKYHNLNSIYNLWVTMMMKFYIRGKSCFENPGISEQKIGISRSEEFFKYKSYTKKHSITINGKTIWFKIDGALRVGDIEFCTQEELNTIIRKLKTLSFFLGIIKIHFQYSPNSKFIKLFENRIKPKKGLPIIFLDLSQKYNYKSMVLSQGDIDTF